VYFTVVMLLVLQLCIATVPAWSYSRGWGYVPSGVCAAVLLGLMAWGAFLLRGG